MKTIAPHELHSLLTGQPDAPLLDVRTSAEFASAHVPQAFNVPLDSLHPKALYEEGRIPRNQPVYLLCQTGGRAELAAEKFAREGFEETVLVEGGTQAWRSAGLPIIGDGSRAISLERQVRIAAGSLVLAGVILSYLVHPWFAGLSGFVGAGLIFAGITDWCGMGLLLAKAPWNHQSTSVNRVHDDG